MWHPPFIPGAVDYPNPLAVLEDIPTDDDPQLAGQRRPHNRLFSDRKPMRHSSVAARSVEDIICTLALYRRPAQGGYVVFIRRQRGLE